MSEIFQFIHAIWDFIGIALSLAAMATMLVLNIVMVTERLMKNKNKKVKDEIQNNNHN